MAYEFDDLRAVLTQKAQSISTTLGLQMQMPNAPFTEPSDGSVWVDFWYKVGKTDQAELGGPAALEMTAGILQFDILVPEKTGDGLGIRTANAIKKKINRKQWLVGSSGYVSLDAADITLDLPTAKAGWYRICVDATFTFFHRDPDADPLQDF